MSFFCDDCDNSYLFDSDMSFFCDDCDNCCEFDSAMSFFCDVHEICDGHGHDDCDVRGIFDGLEDCNTGDDCIVHDASMTGVLGMSANDNFFLPYQPMKSSVYLLRRLTA